MDSGKTALDAGLAGFRNRSGAQDFTVKIVVTRAERVAARRQACGTCNCGSGRPANNI